MINPFCSRPCCVCIYLLLYKARATFGRTRGKGNPWDQPGLCSLVRDHPTSCDSRLCTHLESGPGGRLVARIAVRWGDLSRPYAGDGMPVYRAGTGDLVLTRSR